MSKKLTTEEFIERAKKVHGELYDYGEINYLDSTNKVTIICKIHGQFTQLPFCHMAGRGCPICGKIKVKCRKLTTKEFITRANKIHDYQYKYEKTIYVDNDSKVTILCQQHGEFTQLARSHLSGHGCELCGIAFSKTCHKPKTYNTEFFIKKAKEKHGEKYNYSKVRFIDWKTPVIIICNIHGKFSQFPATHLRSNGCRICSCIKGASSRRPSAESFIIKAKVVHKTRYCYDLTHFTKYDKKITIICRTHGAFKQFPQAHLQGRGCQKCNGGTQSRNKNKKAASEFINKANRIHSHKYNYVKTVYKNNWEKVIIICPKHGEFKQSPSHHLIGNGCRLCVDLYNSKGVKRIEKWLTDNNITFEREKIFRGLTGIGGRELRFDFSINTNKILIEYDGLQHYQKTHLWHKDDKDFEKLRTHDKQKDNWAKSNGYKLIRINYKDENNIESILAHHLLKKNKQTLNTKDYNRSIWG